MAQSSDIFSSKVKPIMDKVFADLQSKRADELEAKSTSLPGLMVGAAGPDGGMAAMDAYTNTVRMTGEWNSKTTEDYIAMVKKELKKQNIKVDAVMEKKMVDYLIQKEIPKSSAEYILRKAAEGTIFSLPQTVNRSALEDHIHNEAERRYDSSLIEVATSSILSWASNAATTMGIGGFWGQTATDVAVEGMNHVSNKEDSYLATQKAQAQKDYKTAEKKSVTIPKWMLTQMGFDRIGNAKDADLNKALKWATSNANIYRNKVNAAIEKGERTVKGSSTKADMSITDATIRAKQYEAFVTAIKKDQTERKTLSASIVTQSSAIAEAPEETAPATENTSQSIQQEHMQADSQQTQSSQDGWNNLIGSIGLEGVGDTMNHLGFTLANLPDMLLGIFTGKTKSIGMNQSTMMPLAAIIAGTFIKNPLLKFPMMLWGGANLVNKMGQEALAEHRGTANSQGAEAKTTYKQYPHELLDKRITNPVIEGDKLILNIDNVPRIVTLTPVMLDAYNQGALPLNVIANRVLSKSDAQQTQNVEQTQHASQRYEQSQVQEQSRGIR